MQSDAATVDEYLAELEPERRHEIAAIRQHFKKQLPKGFIETMAWGMICYEVPLEISGPTYNKRPLVYAGIASQKNYISLYLMSVNASSKLTQKFEQLWLGDGHKLNMGKGCIRIKSFKQASLPAINLALKSATPQEFVATYLAATKRQK